MNVLIADDDDLSRQLLREAVSTLGHQCLAARDGAEAWALYQAMAVDVVVSDWMMPGLTGLELCRMVRGQGALQECYTYFIFLTSYGEREYFLTAMNEGADDFLSKPLNRTDLEIRLRVAGRVTDMSRQLMRQNDELQRLNDQRIRLTSALTQNLGEGVCALDLDGRVTFVNQAAEWLLGRANADLQGQRIEEVSAQPLPLQEMLESGQAFHATERRFRRRDGSSFPVDYVLSPILGDGIIEGAVLAFRDVTERVQSEHERAVLFTREQEARARAERALHLRDQFLSLGSHELRTPLTVLQLQVQSLQRFIHRRRLAELSPERLSANLDTIERQIKRLTKLSNDMVDVTRFAGGEIDLDIQQIDLAALVRQVVERAHYEVSLAGCIVTVEAPGPVMGRWDLSKMEQMIGNLLSNALKHSEGRPVDLAVEREGPNARLRIRDRGTGIQEQDLERIFGRFEQTHSRESAGGLGLGLYIVRRIAAAHGGSVRVDSTPGVGSIFTVELPLSPAREEEDDLRRSS